VAEGVQSSRPAQPMCLPLSLATGIESPTAN
jgi:hypothetical protein